MGNNPLMIAVPRRGGAHVAQDYFHGTEPLDPVRPALYPGERMFATREQSLREGVEVEEKFWRAVEEM